MLTPETLIERVFHDFECVTLAVVTETLGTPRKDAIVALHDFAEGRDNVLRIYSVCYIDENNDMVLSHKSEGELRGIRKVNGRRGVTQMCWRHELEIVERGLKKSLEDGSLYLTSYATLQTGNRRVRQYEHRKQGDSALCTPMHKVQPVVTVSVGVRGPAGVPRSGPQRGTAVISTFFDTGNKKINALHKDTNLSVAEADAELQNENIATACDDAAIRSTVTHDPTTIIGYAMKSVDNVSTQIPDVSMLDLSPSHLRPSKRERTEFTAQVAKHPNDEPEISSLFDCDAPSAAMELDVSSCNDGPVTYVEKVTRESTYVDSGYFVVEETKEYVQVTAPTKTDARTSPKHTRNALGSGGGRKGLLKRPQENLSQSTLMSFFHK